MALSITFNCCLKPSPPSSPPISSLLAPRSKCFRNRCVSIAAACLILSCVDATNGSAVLAVEQSKYVEGSTTERKMLRWSDKIRKCPPWHTNSLENIMPENLPRRSDRRTDGFVSDQGGAVVRFNKSCYSL